MLTARLIDNVWATRKAESLNGLKFMLAEVIGGGPEEGKRLVVVDIISAGIGDRVIWLIPCRHRGRWNWYTRRTSYRGRGRSA